ncbi:MAG: primosomal protein N' [Sphingobacteriales bacterium]|nr:MAG: primosomal protein N' [Sphingobacteriales bacterium]
MPTYAKVILPLSLSHDYSYEVPESLTETIAAGKRVEIQFGQKRVYAGIVKEIFTDDPPSYLVKPILSVLDENPIVTQIQLNFWKWISEYYMCTEGDVMNAALPAAFKLSSETNLELNPSFKYDYSLLTDDEYMIAEALIKQSKITIDDVKLILNKKNVLYIIKSLIEKGAILVSEELVERYKPKMETLIRLTDDYKDENLLRDLFEKLNKAPKQLSVLMAYLQLKNKTLQDSIRIKELENFAQVKSADIQLLVKKGIFIKEDKITSRLPELSDLSSTIDLLTEHQQEAYDHILRQFETKGVILLHGVTSSGKTQLYLKLIQDTLQKGKQALYLVPEIALTSQMINRLRKVFGNDVGIYHSKFNDFERIEIWQKVLNSEYKVILGARSALLLPFVDLGLTIVDEEHDTSFKQFDPAPRYHARDAAIYMSSLFKAKTILGSATPSLESYYNATKTLKYGLVTLDRRYGDVEPPQIEIVNMIQAAKKNEVRTHFSKQLIHEMTEALNLKEQVILFQNRRGYAPYVSCETCGWIPQCPHCDVSLTYHKYSHELKCHYCGYKMKSISKCKLCSSTHFAQHGFGTEKIEDDLKAFFPHATINRLDWEVARTKTGFEKVIADFEKKQTDILVGTQMVTKGLDFDHVNVVGILSADQLINYPDFRSAERAFQLMLQVSGRAGRRAKQGKVIIQTKAQYSRIIEFVLQNNYTGFFTSELYERAKFRFPPFTRLIMITLKHTNAEKVNHAAFELAKSLKSTITCNLLGPSVPAVARIRNYYLRQILIKIEQNSPLTSTKQQILQTISQLNSDINYKQVVVQLDVDPY